MLVGEKTVECRTWQTSYRGPLLISSSNIKTRGTIPGHALIVANLIDIQPFSKKHLEAAGLTAMPENKSFAWILEDFKPVIPFKLKGKLSLFDTDDNLIKFVNENVSDDELSKIYNPLFI